MRFRVKAVDLDGAEYLDSVDAEGASALYESLRSEGYTVTSIQPVQAGPLARVFQGSSAADLAMASEHLSRFVESGVALPAALRAVARDMGRSGFHTALEQAAADVESGMDLYAALAKQGDRFPALFRFIIAAGLAAGRLGPALLLVSDYYETAVRLRQRLIEGLIYPSILVCGMVVLALQAACLVGPRFQILYTELAIALPLPTRMSLYAVHNAGEWLPWVGFALAACLCILMACARSEASRYAMDRAIFSIPAVGGMLRSYVTAKLASALALLVGSDVPAPRALRIIADAEPNSWVRRALHGIADRAEQGVDIADAFAQAPNTLLPNTFLWVVASATGTNSLAHAAQRLSELYAAIAKRRFEMIETLIGPAIVVLLGLATLFVAGALLLPLLQALYVL